MTNDGKLELSLMHFHHTNPKWQMPKHCEDYLEKIQEHGKSSLSHSPHLISHLAMENVFTSAVLQQSCNQVQQSCYHDGTCKIQTIE